MGDLVRVWCFLVFEMVGCRVEKGSGFERLSSVSRSCGQEVRLGALGM